MAIAFGASLGSTTSDGSDTTSLSHTTTATVPAGGLVIVSFIYYGTGTPSCTVGGNTATLDASWQRNAGDTQYRQRVFSYYAAGGLASSSTVALSWTSAVFERNVCVIYITGAASSSYVDVVSAEGNSTGLTWASAAASTTTADTFLWGVASLDFVATTSTPLDSMTEVFDLTASSNTKLVGQYKVVSATGSYQARGTWVDPGGQQWLAGLVAYKADAGGGGGGGTTPDLTMPRMR